MEKRENTVNLILHFFLPCVRPISSYMCCNCHSGKKSKSSSVTLDYDLAEGLVNLEKLKNHMQSTLGKLQTELKDKLNVKIQPRKQVMVPFQLKQENELE